METNRTCRLRRTHGLSVMAACVLFCWTAAAKDVTWAGATGANWDTSSQNWVLTGTATPAAFANGDNVTFDDSCAGTSCKIAANVTPGALVVRRDNDFTFIASKSIQDGMTSFDKYGTGTLFMEGNVSLATCDIHIWGGTIKNTKANSQTSFGGSDPFKVYVHDGAKFWCYERNSSGDVTGGFCDVTVYTNGVFDVSKNNSGVTPVRSLTLNGGTFKSSKIDENYGVLKIEKKFTALGPAPYVISNAVGYTKTYITLGYDSETEFEIADITGDDAPDVTFYTHFMHPSSWTGDHVTHGLVKTGPGTMRIMANFAENFSNWTNRAPSGAYVIKEGTLDFGEWYSLNPATDAPVYVNTNATLKFTKRNVMTGERTVPVRRPIVVDHGTFVMSDTVGSSMVLGPLTLDHATFDFGQLRGFYAGWGRMVLTGKVTVRDDHPVVWSMAGIAQPANAPIHLWDKPLTAFDVPDITGDGAADMIIEYPLYDVVTNNNGNTLFFRGGCGLAKEGVGTLCLSNRFSKFTGDIEVREGTLMAGADIGENGVGGTQSYLGAVNAQRTITVYTNATLYLPNRNTFKSVTETNLNVNGTIRLLGGTLKLREEQVNILPNMLFEDGAIDYAKHFAGFGTFMFAGRAAFCGTRPYVFPRNGDSAMSLNGGLLTTFDVADVTGDAAADVTIDIPIIQHQNATTAHGFVKTGAGTLCLTFTNGWSSATRSLFTGDVLVSNGTLRVDNNIAVSHAVVVEAGGFLSGTGTVNNVLVAAGGGFAATAGQKGMLTIAGDATVPATGVVEIANPRGMETNRILVKFATVEGALTIPDDLSGWTVKVDGVTMPNGFALLRQGNTLVAGCVQGTMLIFR